MYRRPHRILHNVRVGHFSTSETGAKKPGSAMANFLRGAAAAKPDAAVPGTGASSPAIPAQPLWSRLVRDLTPPPKPEGIARQSQKRGQVSKHTGRGGVAGGRGGGRGSKKSSDMFSSESGSDDRHDRGNFRGAWDIDEDDEDEQQFNLEIDRELDVEVLRNEQRIVDDRNDDPKYIPIDDPEEKYDDDFEEGWFPNAEYQADAKEGSYACTDNTDELEGFFLHAFFECYKSSDNTYRDGWALRNLDNIKIPQPRSMKYLWFAQQPWHNIELGTAGAANAELAWSVVHKNIKYADHERRQLVNVIGERTNAVYKHIKTGPLSNTYEAPSQAYDPVFRFGFRPGLEGVEREEKEKSLRAGRSKVSKQYMQDDTNWDVEAVEDEDNL